MKKIKVLHILSPLGNYGKERWLLAFLRKIDRSIVEPRVILLAPGGDPEIASHIKQIGIEYMVLESSSKFSSDDIKIIREEIIAAESDIVHSHDYKSDVYALFAARGLSAKKISTPHGWCATGDRKLGLYEKIDRIFLRHFDSVAPLSEKMASTLKRIKKKKLIVINNFVDLDTIPVPEEGDPRLIAYMGRLVSLKRVDDLINALAMVKDKETRLQIIGDGPMRGELESLAERLSISDRIDFLGHRNDSLDLLNRSRIMVLPSLTEGISRSIMEAMAMGKIVISTRIPGITELITDGRNGYLVETRDPKAIADVIDRIFGNMAKAVSVSANARTVIENDFSAARVVRDYEKLYSSLL
ncbi:MAG: glycosyltransferase [Candidatus Krumholzibacteriota bacterium]|nr:glycosyltransferase [Candidatus Krumholzibacteriota bacterium]